MQTIGWYWRRLRAMSPGEVCWRLGATVQESVDRCALPVRTGPTPLSKIATGNGSALSVRSSVISKPWPEKNIPPDESLIAASWRDEAVAQADRLLENRLSFFDVTDHDFGAEVEWNYECVANKRTPLAFAPRVDYRDFSVAGDAKVVWEPNRHQHLVVLGRAYRMTGDRRYAEKVLEQIESWIRQCPYGRGMNWRSPLELAIRVINWAWALELVAPSGVVTPERMARILPVVHRHLWEIDRKYSKHSSANNHTVGEAAGVFIGASYFASLRNADIWCERARTILVKQIERQVLSDGGHCELATGYHLFVLEFCLAAGMVARHAGADFPESFWAHLEKMFEFVAGLIEGGESLPMFGDADDGYVLDLGGQRDRPRSLLAVGAALFDRADFLARARAHGEPSFWLLGVAGSESAAGASDETTALSIESRANSESGYYTLQCGDVDAPDRVSVTLDCGPLGYGAIAAHGHADALSITLRAFGVDVLVDPGTYDYFTHASWRDYFRSTRAHNTVEIDGRDQSQMLGPFLWGRRATARCTRWEPTAVGGSVSGEHDGYRHLHDPVAHRRTVSLDASRGDVLIMDELSCVGPHEAALHFHFAEQCTVDSMGGHRFRVDCGRGTLTMTVDSDLSVELVRGGEQPILGWVSRCYHGKQASTTLRACRHWTGDTRVETRIALEG